MTMINIGQRTFAMIKPDAVEKNIVGKIISKIEEKGFNIVAIKKLQLTRGQAEEFYREHALKPFFNGLIDFMTRGPIIAMVLEKENCVLEYRQLMGATKPEEQVAGTIRKEFATSIQENCVHGSDSIESARREVHFFFNDLDLIK